MKRKNRILNSIIIALVFLCGYFYKVYGINLNRESIGDFATIFISIILEAVPFILIGSFISAIIQIYVSEETITKLIPTGSVLAYFEAALAGLLFPVCECAIIPITRRLIKKGLPTGVGVTFMLAVPIINPVVIMSTYYAFYDKQGMVLLRTFGGFAAAIIIGMIVNIFQGNKDLLLNSSESDSYCSCGCNSYFGEQNKIKAVLEHTNREFLDITRYLIFGAFISSVFQVMTSNGSFKFISSNKILVIIFMMFLAFLLSLCSEADAFVGRTFLSQYSVSGVVAFLILGPMLDIKNLIILSGTFKKSFVAKLVITTISVVFIISCLFMIVGI